MAYKTTVIIFLTIFLALHESQDVLEVKVEQGILRGKYWKSRKGRTFSGFTGIPYANPPVGNLRFKAPVPVTMWEGILDASQVHEACPQISIYLENYPTIGNEDCLYLNVYTPQLPSRNRKLLPVMFYIHGGSFIMGSARHDWLGPEILLDKDIVLVTVNYRLGAFGFLSTADEVVPGNNGLKDQASALNWIKQNVVHFGGDPKRITIVGNSAGAACAHLHMFSPLTKDLIKGAIVQSGSAISSYAVVSDDQVAKNAFKLGSLLNCSSDSSQELIKCLRKCDAYDIIKQDVKFASWDNDSTIAFRPVVESNGSGAFITEFPAETLKSGKDANIPLMTGITTQEAAYKSADMNSKPKLLDILDKRFHLIIPPTFGITSDKLNSSKAIRKFYFGDKRIDNSTKSELTDMYSDGWWLLNSDFTIKLHAEYSVQPIYQYLFGYRGSTSYSTLFGDPTHDYGVSHTDELLYLFTLGMTFPDYEPTDSDIKMSEIMITLWTNFVETGNPTPEVGPIISTKWKPIQTENLEYYHIKNYTDLRMAECLYANRTKFWRSLPIGIISIDNNL